LTDHAKIELAKRLGVHDELYASDVGTFSYPKPFDAIIAVEAVHCFLDAELVGRLEGLAKRGGLIVFNTTRFAKVYRREQVSSAGLRGV
jgi:hypothetical protein